MGTENTLAGCELERTAKTEMGIQLESGNGAVTEVQETRRVKTSQVSRQRIPRWGILLFVILAAFAVARTLQRGVETAKTTQPPVRPVLVAKVISKDVPLYLDEIGTCAAYETVQVQAQVSGQIIARHFQDGADVKKGDLLFTIDPRPYQAALEQAQAQATLDQITMKRQQELRARNVISPQDLDTAQANAHKSEAAAAAAQVNIDFCYIKSPINGRAGLRLVDVGNIVSGNTGSGAVLLTIQGLDPIYTDFTVAETDLALVRKYLGGPNVKVQTYSPDDKIPPRLGDLYFIDTAVQPGSGTVKARGVTPNPDHAFWPSEFVRVRFILDTIKDARLLPSQDRHHARSTSAAPKEAKLVSVKGTGLSGPFIRRPVMTILLTLSVIVAGIVTYNKLAVNDLPAVDYPIIQVTCAYPGADPVTMANNIATPLEKQFLQIPGLDIITSQSTQGNTSLTLQFVLSKSITDAATDVQAAIQRATGKLPIDLPSPPTFSKTNPNDQAVYLLGLLSDTLTDGDLYKYASTAVAQRIAILPGVSQVNIYGVQGAIRIKADPAALASRGLTMDDVASAIKAGTVYSGAGQFDGPHRSFVLQPNGQIDQADGYRNLIVARNKDRSPVYLRDIAEVKQGVQDERTSRFFWMRGFNPPGSIVVLAVSRQAGANAVEVANSVKALFPELRASLPGSITFTPVFDRSQTIVNSVHDVRATLLIAFVLVVMVIYIFLGRATDTLIPAVALPLSLLLTFAVMSMLGFSINNLTLMALTLAIGFLVDDAIVFLENVIRRAEHGESIVKAAYNTAGEISFTILSMTLSLAAVFIPLVFLPGLLGRIFQEFSITIIVAILASGLVSLTLTPLMCARILGERRVGHKRARMERWTGNFIKRVIDAYSRALDRFLDRAWLTIPILLVCILGLWFFFTHLPFTLLPPGDSGFARGVFIAQEGSSPEQMRAFQKLVNEKIIAEQSGAQFFTLAGSGSRSSSSQGIIFCIFKPREQRDPI